MGCANSKLKPPALFGSDQFFGVGRFVDNDIVYPVYTPRKCRHFFMGRVPKGIQPTNSLVALSNEYLEEHIYIKNLLKDYPVETGETLILNAHYKFREDRSYGIIPIVYFCPTQKKYKAAWWYVTEILLPPADEKN